MRFSPSCECCVVCPIASDSFEREEVGANWDDISGTWEIVDDALTTADSNAMILYNLDHPAGVTAHIVAVDVRGAVGQIAKIVISDALGGAPLTLELTFGSSSGEQCGTLSIGPGFHSRPIAGVPENTWIRIGICFLNETEIDADAVSGPVYGRAGANVALTSNQTISHPGLSIATSVRVGLATGASSGGVEFDNFQWFSHRIPGNEEYENCDTCDSCLMWQWTGQEDGCEFSVTNDPHTDANWSVTGLIEAAGVTDVDGIGIIAERTGGTSPGEMTLVLGDYEAHFYVPTGEMFFRCDLTGPGGLSETEDFENCRFYSLSYINGIICASTNWVSSTGNKSLTAVPPAGMSGAQAAGAYGPDAQPNLVLTFTRCPQCPADNVCDACEDDTTTSQFYKITLAGFGENDFCVAVNNCHLANGSFILAQGFLFACSWVTVIPADCGTIVISLTMGGGAIAVTVNFSWTSPAPGLVACSQTYTFQKVYGGLDDLSSVPCDSLDDYLDFFSFESNDGTCFEILGFEACTSGSATCRVQSM